MLSICIPTYNRADLLERSLKHLLSFSELDIEVNVSNNNSNDNTLKIIKKYENKFTKFNFISTTKLISIQQNFDLAAKLATQKYTMLMPDDDLANETDLIHGIKLLESNERIMAAFGGFKKYNLNNELLEELKRSDKVEVYNNENAQVLLSKHVSLDLPLYRTILQKYVTNPHANFSSISWEFIGIALSHGDICITPYSFFNHFSHKNQYTNIHNNNSHVHFLMISEAEMFLDKLKCSANEKVQAIINYKALYYRYMMWNSYQNNDLIQARWAIKKGLIYHPALFLPLAEKWDQENLVTAVIQDLNNSILAKPHLKRVFVYSCNESSLSMLHNALKGKLLIEPKRIIKNTDLEHLNENQNLIIFFDDIDKEFAKYSNNYNSEVFMNTINSLKFSSNNVTFQ